MFYSDPMGCCYIYLCACLFLLPLFKTLHHWIVQEQIYSKQLEGIIFQPQLINMSWGKNDQREGLSHRGTEGALQPLSPGLRLCGQPASTTKKKKKMIQVQPFPWGIFNKQIQRLNFSTKTFRDVYILLLRNTFSMANKRGASEKHLQTTEWARHVLMSVQRTGRCLNLQHKLCKSALPSTSSGSFSFFGQRIEFSL